jgi:hypothetical protein
MPMTSLTVAFPMAELHVGAAEMPVWKQRFGSDAWPCSMERADMIA